MRTRIVLILVLVLALLSSGRLAAQENGLSEPEADGIDRTPPRLSFVEGQVSFFRPGADEWVRAPVNTPLSPGDQLYTGSPGNLELQIASRAFVRGWANTQIGLENHEPDYIQFKVTTGHAAFDLRALEPGLTVEVATPNAAFTIERAGYYRVDVIGERTAFIARRGGRAVATPADGTAFSVAASEEVVIEGEDSPRISSFAAPPLDTWDSWNYSRTDRLLEAESFRYVVPGVYGASDLDRHGRWRVLPEYGPVWIPTGVASGWAPYSTGSWVHDPYYGWSWVDTAPWGWAPYHYGRWVHVGGFWGWAPGPAVVRPVYSPALVAFLGDPHSQAHAGFGSASVGWVALSWGEPCVPWWGRPGFIHRPWWGGWGGPRIVNNVVVHRTTVVKVEEIHIYRNTGVRNGVVATHKDRFGHGRIHPHRGEGARAENLHPMHKGPEIKPTPAAFVPGTQRGIRPAEKHLKRAVVATRSPHSVSGAGAREERKPDAARGGVAAPLIVPSPRQINSTDPLPRPPFGKSALERRPDTRRTQQPLPAKGDEQRRVELQAEARQPSDRKSEQPPRPPQKLQRPETPDNSRRINQSESRAPSPPAANRVETQRPPQRKLPGEPASRLAPNRAKAGNPHDVDHGGKTPPHSDKNQAPAGSNPNSKGRRAGGITLSQAAAQ